MMKLFKYLRPFWLLIVIIIGLLFTQANCDLALPEYMSKIVNTGIQQYGIEEAIPSVISKSEFERISLFLDDADIDKVKSSYISTSVNKLKSSEKFRFIAEMPLRDDESLYRLRDDVDTKDFELAMGKAMTIVYGIEHKEAVGFGTDMQIPEGMDPFILLSNMPKEQLETIKVKANEKLSSLSDLMVKQASVLYIKAEYEKIGLDIDTIQKDYVILSGFKMLGIALLSMLTSVTVGFIAARLSAGLGRNLRKSLFSKVEKFSNAEFDKFGASSLITRTTNDIQQVQNLMVMLLRIVFYAPILGIGGVIKVLATDTSMGWIIVVALTAILIVVIAMFIFALPKFKIVQKLIDKLNLVTRESLTGMLVIRAFNNEKHEEAKFNKANRNLTKTHLFIGRMMSGMFPLMMLIMNVITILIVWVGAYQIDSGVIQVGDMMAFIQYTMQIIMSFLMITMISIMLPRATVSAGRVDEVLSTEPIIVDPKEPKSFKLGFKGNVKFDNVSFKYADADDYVLKNINFEAKAGETTAFIGSTGSGKSTIVNLIPRFYDVTEGSIKIDGIDIREVTQYDLRQKIGYVPQRGTLFSGTIASNLKYGREDATKEDMEKAANVSQALAFIEEKTHKFNEGIAEGGSNVSGGQKQRLSIARALIKKPEIFIFDDTFSALDFKTDASLRKALKKETKSSTVLIVAQRISTILNADRIIVLDQGKIVGIGTHKELMKKCKVYKEIALSQLSKEELA